MSCYEQFGWTPKDILELPESEAILLSIYFEEVSAHQYRERKKQEAQSSAAASPGGFVDEQVLGDADEEYAHEEEEDY